MRIAHYRMQKNLATPILGMKINKYLIWLYTAKQGDKSVFSVFGRFS